MIGPLHDALKSLLRHPLRSAACASLLIAALSVGGCEQGRMLSDADAQLHNGQYEQALTAYQKVRKETPIQGYRVRADQGIAAASQALKGSVRESSVKAAAAGKPGLALLYEARAEKLAGNKDYDPRHSPRAGALLSEAALKIKIEATDSASSPVIQLLSDRLTSTALLRATDDAGQADGKLRIGIIERPLLSEQNPIRKTVSYASGTDPGPNPEYDAQKKRRDTAKREAEAAQTAYQHQQTLQFAGEGRVNNGNNVNNDQRRYAWLEAERLRKVSEAASQRLANEDRKLSETPQTVQVPHYDKYTFDAKQYEQDLTGEVAATWHTANGGPDDNFSQPLRVSVRDDAYPAQPKVKLLAKGPSLPKIEDLRYTFQQQGVTYVLEWMARLETQRRDEIQANARGAGKLDPTEAAIAYLISGSGPVPVAQATELNAQIEKSTGVADATALLGIEARSPSIVDINPNNKSAPKPQPK